MSSPTLSAIEQQNTACIHAACVSVEGHGLLIVGRSGAGKSSLALQMMALGARLVADDRVNLHARDGHVIADAVPELRGVIEARGIGLLRADSKGPVPVSLVADLDQSEPARLPEPRMVVLLRHPVPLLWGGEVPNLAAALVQFMKMGRMDPEWPGN